MKNSKRLLALAVAAACGAPMAAYATNGMNLEGYGPIATGMGGASMAYDNGTAAMMNNPATLGAMADGSRLDVAVGVLGPNVKATTNDGAASWSSGGDAYLMPAVGYAKKNGQLTWGVGAFAQGGMGTEYKNGGPGGGFAAYDVMTGGTPGGGLATVDPNAVAGLLSTTEERSEVGVMRVLVPVAYEVNDKFTVGGSIDYVRASMDFKWLMPGSQMFSMMGTNLTGSMIDAMGAAFGPPGSGVLFDLYGGYFDASDNSDYSGQMTGDGFSGKLGFTYKVNPQLSIGGVYHPKTNISDLSGNANISMALTGDQGYLSGGAPNSTPMDAVMTLSGKIKIIGFEWPETYGFGFSYQANDKWFIAGDVKAIMWSGVMKDFKMSFTADNTASNGDFAGLTMDASLPMNWKDQTVVQLGASYKATDALIVRFGTNMGTAVVPDDTLHYLFPATVENHYTAGFGYSINNASSVDFSMTYAPEVKVTNPAGFNVTHSQTNWQLMYSHRF